MGNAIRRIKDVRLWNKFGIGFKSPNYISFAVRKRAGVLEFQDFISYQSRNLSIQSLILLSDQKYSFKDFDWKIINAGDVFAGDHHREIPVFSVVVNQNNFARSCPDFVYLSWKETGLVDYESVTRKLSEFPLPNTKKLGWRGNNNHLQRSRLVEISKGLEDVDIDFVNWVEDGRKGYLRELSANFLSYEEQVKKWRYFADIEGTGYSGRLKILLACKRLTFLIERTHKEWFFEAMQPWVHFVPVSNDMGDLLEKLEFMRRNESAEQKILASLGGFSESFLSRKAAIERWGFLLKSVH